jgi:hypothetical protein
MRRLQRIASTYERLSMPLTAYFLLGHKKFPRKYKMTWWRKVTLSVRLYRNWRAIRSGISYKAHLAMAVKLMELEPDAEGVVVECGCWLGGTTANLSVICDIVDRQLIVYDSFEGLPAPEPLDNMKPNVKGTFRGDLDVVRANVARYGVIERCEFRKGWFRDTLGSHTEPIALLLVDVDLKSSIHECIVNLWPHLIDKGYVFFDEYVHLHNCALFYSERFWREYLDTTPPGLVGAGAGIGVGQYFIGPWRAMGGTPLHRPGSVAYTRKDYNGLWDYAPLPSDTR